MQIINKKAFIFSAVAISLACVAQLAFGASISNPLGGAGVNDFPILFGKIAVEVGKLIAGLGTVMFIVAGIMYILSAGSTGQMEKAKTALIYAIIGMIVGLSAGAIVAWIQSVTG